MVAPVNFSKASYRPRPSKCCGPVRWNYYDTPVLLCQGSGPNTNLIVTNDGRAILLN